MTNTLIPHKHAALIIEWAYYVATGEVDAGWYYVQSRLNQKTDWYLDNSYNLWFDSQEYRIVMTAKHPDYKPPTRKVAIEFELTEEEISRALESFYSDDPIALHEGCVIGSAVIKALKAAK